MNPFILLAVVRTERTVQATLLGALVIFVVAFVLSIPWMLWFRREWKYLTSEIGRNYGKERERWKRRRRRLLLSIIPFVKYR